MNELTYNERTGEFERPTVIELIYNEQAGEFEPIRKGTHEVRYLKNMTDETSFYYLEGFSRSFPLWEIKMMHLPQGTRVRRQNENKWFIIDNT